MVYVSNATFASLFSSDVRDAAQKNRQSIMVHPSGFFNDITQTLLEIKKF